MSRALGLTLEELVGVLKHKGARIPFEIGAFVVLEVCEGLVTGPAIVTTSDVRITEDGRVAVAVPPGSATSSDAARAVARLLAFVLVAAGPGVPPALLDLVERGPSDGRWELGRLRDELEAALVPLNRGAARRVLSRMLREAGDVKRAGALRPAASQRPTSRSSSPLPTASLGSAPSPSASPRSVSPGSASPGSVSPGSASPGSVSPGSVSPGSASPGSASPGSVSPRSLSPRSLSQRPPPPSPEPDALDAELDGLLGDDGADEAPPPPSASPLAPAFQASTAPSRPPAAGRAAISTHATTAAFEDSPQPAIAPLPPPSDPPERHDAATEPGGFAGLDAAALDAEVDSLADALEPEDGTYPEPPRLDATGEVHTGDFEPLDPVDELEGRGVPSTVADPGPPVNMEPASAPFSAPAVRPEPVGPQAPPEEAAPSPSPSPSPQETTPALGPRAVAVDDLEAFDTPRKSGEGKGLVWAALFLLLTVGLVVSVVVFRPDLIDRAMGRRTPEEIAAEADVERQRQQAVEAAAAHRRSFGHLTVEVDPAEAQVLRFVGRGPVTVPALPVGMALEFVAIADGRAPTRAVVPADAEWDTSGETPRYELGMQTGDDEMEPRDLALGGTRLSRDAMGQDSGERGEVRVITTPPGAKVYLLIGFAPRVEVTNVSVEEPVELLVWKEDYEAERAAVMPSDWNIAEGEQQPSATVQVTLDER